MIIYVIFDKVLTMKKLNAESFKRYLESLDVDQIQALSLDLAANGGGEKYSDSVELLQVFYLFYYINGRLPYTTSLLAIPDGEFPAFVDGQKISIKKLYEEFCGSVSHDDDDDEHFYSLRNRFYKVIYI